MSVDSVQRSFLFDLWERIHSQDNLSTMEKQVKKIIEMHPETHSVFSNRETFESHEFGLDEPDPFAHIGLHSIIVEMISNDEPRGIRSCYDKWVSEVGDKHQVQHEFMLTVMDAFIAGAEDSDKDVHQQVLAELEEKYALMLAKKADDE